MDKMDGTSDDILSKSTNKKLFPKGLTHVEYNKTK